MGFRSCVTAALGLVVFAAQAEARPWRVALRAHDMPFSAVETEATETTSAEGLYVEWWQALAERLSSDVTFVGCDDDAACLALLKTGAVDFLGPRPFVDDSTLAFTRPVSRRYVYAVFPSNRPLRGPHDLRGRRVALPEALRREAIPVRNWSPELMSVVPATQAWAALSLGSADAAIFSGRHPPALLGMPKVPLWFRWQHVYAQPSFRTVLAELDRAIDDVNLGAARIGRSSISVGVDELWLRRQARPAVELGTLRFINAHPTIRLGASPWAPLAVDADGRFDGMALRVVDHHVTRAGVTPVYLGEADWNQVKLDATIGRYDGLGFVVASAKSRLSPLVFSDEMIDLPMVAVARTDSPFWADFEDLADKRLVANPMYGELLALVESGSLRGFVEERSGRRALDMVRSGEVDAWLEYLPIVRDTITNAGATDVKLALRLGGPRGARMAIQPHWAPLLPLVNHSIRTTAPDEVSALYVRWNERPDEPSLAPRTVAAGLAIIATLCLLLVVLARRLLRENRTVQQRERALRRAQLLSGVGSLELVRPYEKVYLDGETPTLLGLPAHTYIQSLEDHLAMFNQPGRLLAALERVKTGVEAPVRLDVEVKGAPPQIFTYELAAPQRVDGRDGVITGTVQDVTDVRARVKHAKALEQQVLHLQKQDAIGRLAGGIAHDFNNILSASIGYTELALADLPVDHPSRFSVEQVLKASERSRDLVKRILSFSRREAENYQPIRLDLCVEEALTLLRASLPGALVLDLDISEAAVWVNGDSSQLTQIVMNLVTNAVDALNGRGKIAVALNVVEERAGAFGGVARLIVSDDGPGIEASVRDQIFDPFFTTKDLGKGTGLGLSIVQGILRAHNGGIELESESGRGASFIVTLPTIPPPAVVRPPASLTLPDAGRSVLIVDDEKALTDIYGQILRRQGYSVEVTNSPERAIQMFADDPHAFDVILTDLTMPGLSGLSVAERIRQLNPDVALVLITGFCVDPGASGLFREVLQKPVSNDDLLATVARALPPSPAETITAARV